MFRRSVAMDQEAERLERAVTKDFGLPERRSRSVETCRGTNATSKYTQSRLIVTEWSYILNYTNLTDTLL